MTTVALFTVYLDDSADKGQKSVMVAGGLLAAYKVWREFTKKWKTALRRDQIDYFKSSEYYSLSGQFERFRDDDLYPIPKERLTKPFKYLECRFC